MQMLSSAGLRSKRLMVRAKMPWPEYMMAGVLILSVGFWCFFNVGHWLAAPQDDPVPADVVVVLGGGGKERLSKALDLYQAGYGQQVLLIGLNWQADRLTTPYLHWRSRLLLAWGVPREALLFDDQSRNSYEEAEHAAKLMTERRWRSALVVSDPPHLRRVEMVWNKVAAQYGIDYRLIASEPKSWDAARWWRDKVWAKFVGMELVKLAYYAAVY